MAISATQIFEHHPECYKSEARELFREGNDPFHLPELHFTRQTADSVAINRISAGAIIMAGEMKSRLNDLKKRVERLKRKLPGPVKLDDLLTDEQRKHLAIAEKMFARTSSPSAEHASDSLSHPGPLPRPGDPLPATLF